jgi:hypothetical protein
MSAISAVLVSIWKMGCKGLDNTVVPDHCDFVGSHQELKEQHPGSATCMLRRKRIGMSINPILKHELAGNGSSHPDQPADEDRYPAHPCGMQGIPHGPHHSNRLGRNSMGTDPRA